MAKRTTIRCPHCGFEYLPAEIYYPDTFLGVPSSIIRDEKGQILGFKGSDMNTSEEFYCNGCDKPFSVDAVVTFKTNCLVDMFADDADFKDIDSNTAMRKSLSD